MMRSSLPSSLNWESENKEVPEKVYITLGRLSVTFGYLEVILHDMISELLDVDIAYAYCILSGDSFRTLLSKASNCVHMMTNNAKILGEFEQLRKELNKVSEDRNTFLHSYWVLGVGEKEFHRQQLRKKVTDRRMYLVERWGVNKLKEVDEISERCLKLGKRLSDFYFTYSVKPKIEREDHEAEERRRAFNKKYKQKTQGKK